ncbi:pullulanase [Longirhabdus pacifica]|uniref:pullulanase n=1 Tax=Longirhabdus pacifica TaxID=2305227 RepID=UPI001008D369|nr:pullulanase [Longirhabdus pacifica]
MKQLLSKRLHRKLWVIGIMFMFTFTSIFTGTPVQTVANEIESPGDSEMKENVIPENHIRIHYQRTDGEYEEYGLWLFNDVVSPSNGWPSGALPFTNEQQDHFGAYVDVPLQDSAKNVGLVVVNRANGEKDGGDKLIMIATPEMKEVWISEGSDMVHLFEPVMLPDQTIRIHYVREDQNFDDLGLWLWGDVKTASDANGEWPTGATSFSDEQRDDFGAYVDVTVQETAAELGFVIVNKVTGDKDGGDKIITISPEQQHYWMRENDDAIYQTPYWESSHSLQKSEIISENELLLTLSTTEELQPEEWVSDLVITDANEQVLSITSIDVINDIQLKITLASMDLNHVPLSVTHQGQQVSADIGWRWLDEQYAYDGDDLGATYHEDGSATLKLWAPMASDVVAHLYDKNDATKQIGTAALTLGEQGVWSVTLEPAQFELSDVQHYFYQYEVTNNGVTKKVLDPYGKSMAAFRVNSNGEVGADGDEVGKSAIVDLQGTDPKGYDFAKIDGYEKREHAIIWEVHIRDFTSDPSIEDDLNKVRWGSYQAFIEKLDYIKSLGVTHVQLLPVMAWYYGDELGMDERETEYAAAGNAYNWGYDPHHYFSPDGAYSEDAEDPELRIKELKQLIHAIHEAEMGVILDVVYTHTAKSSTLNDIVPDYYYWVDQNGSFVGGFGNNLATNHKMAEKLMVDSVRYWFEEYRIDGMRFDMMGDATYEAVQQAYDAAAKVNPNALFIGEGWRTFSAAEAEPSLAGLGATQDWMNQTNDVAVFSDEIRNELKSGFGSEGEPRFITGGARNLDVIFNNIKGQPSNTPADDPGDMVQYIAAHDNLPLYDVIAHSIKKDPAIPENNEEILKRMRLGNTMILTSQGTVFLHAGQEYGRTKQWLSDDMPEQKFTELLDEDGKLIRYMIHDSYDSSDAVNQFDWEKATNKKEYPAHNLTRAYTEGLIELRQYTNAFRLGDQAQVDTLVTRLEAPEMEEEDLVIAYKNIATDGTGEYYVFINADDKERTLTLSEDLSKGKVIVDDDEAGTKKVKKASGFTLTKDNITLQPLTAVVIQIESKQLEMLYTGMDSTDENKVPVDQQQIHFFFNDNVKVKKESWIEVKVHGDVVDQSDYVISTNNNELIITLQDELWHDADYAINIRKGALQSERGKLKQKQTLTSTFTTEKMDDRYIVMYYDREEHDYEGWDIWTWFTGANDGGVAFSELTEDKTAKAIIPIGPEATNVGFKLRQGGLDSTGEWNDWLNVDIDADRSVTTDVRNYVTKVFVQQEEFDITTLPAVTGPVMEDGNITFYYRDEAMYAKDKLNTLSLQVQVKNLQTDEVQVMDMEYHSDAQYFHSELADLEEGEYEYVFLVTRGNTTYTMLDPYVNDGTRSTFRYAQPEINFQPVLSKNTLSYDENVLLKVDMLNADATFELADMYVDLSELGGNEHTAINTEINEIAFGVHDDIPMGEKNITVTIVDAYGNKIMQPIPIEVVSSPSPTDAGWDESIIYFVVTDRFADGDEMNNGSEMHSDEAATTLERYRGGDFQGLIDNMDYLQELGINTLWITPVVDNVDHNINPEIDHFGYHGYWAKNFEAIDEHLGKEEKFMEFIDAAHEKGMKVMVDVVLNHAGYGLKETDAAVEGITAEDKARFAGMFRGEGDIVPGDPFRDELAGLPDFKTEDPAVRAQVIAWQTELVEKYNIDYFRIDTLKHIEDETWISLKNELTKIDPTFKMIGEYYGGGVYNQEGYLNSGMMDSLLDFDFNEQARDFVNGEVTLVNQFLQERNQMIDNKATLGQFLSSHDENGFLYEMDGDEGKLKVAAALQITAKGQPVIYYGEELGRTGQTADFSQGIYSENRTDMPWGQVEIQKNEEHSLLNHYKKLLEIRNEYSHIFAKGTRGSVVGNDELGYLVFDRQYEGKSLMIGLNVTDKEQEVTLTGDSPVGTVWYDEYNDMQYTVQQNQQLVVTIPGKDQGGTFILSSKAMGEGQ